MVSRGVPRYTPPVAMAGLASPPNGGAIVSAAQIVIAAAWMVLAVVFGGMGLAVARILRVPDEGADRLLLAFWLGWAAAVFVLELWQLAAPVQPRAPLVVAALGVAGFAACARRPLRDLARRPLRAVAAVALGLAVTWWLSNLAQGGPQHGDSGLYHVPTIRWLVERPIVPGLGNLFFALGDNQSSFLYTAMLEWGPLAHRSHHVANGILVLILFGRALLGAARVLGRRDVAPVDLFYALLIPAVADLALGINLTSPSPDAAVFGLGIVLSGEVVALLTRSPSAGAGAAWARGATSAGRLLALVALAAAGITVKLSFAGLAVASVVVGVLFALVHDRPPLRAVARVVAAGFGIALLGLVPWTIRGVVLTGYPAFPSLVGGVDVPWRLPPAAAAEVLGPYMFEVPWSAPFRQPAWFLVVLERFGWRERDVVVPATIAAVALAVALVVRLATARRSVRPAPYLSALIVVPPIVSALYCFIAGRLARYVGASIWILAAEAVVLVARGRRHDLGRAFCALAAVGALALAWLPVAHGRPLWRDLHDFEEAAAPRVHPVTLASGLVVNVPEVAQSCWDAPLPCTPFPNPALRLRRAGDLGSGFVLDPTLAASGG